MVEISRSSNVEKNKEGAWPHVPFSSHGVKQTLVVDARITSSSGTMV